MSPLLVCCIGNAFLSPVFAILYDAEAAAVGVPLRAISAGLTGRTEMPPTGAHLLAAADRVLAGSPALARLQSHRPTPLRTRAFEPVSGVLYLHEGSRTRRHLLDDAKVISAWLAPAPTPPVIHLSVEDPGFRLWEERGHPPVGSTDGDAVVNAYAEQIQVLRLLARALVATGTGAEGPAAGLLVIPGGASLPEPIRVLPPSPIVEIARAPRTPPEGSSFARRLMERKPGERAAANERAAENERAPATSEPSSVGVPAPTTAVGVPSPTPPEGRRRRVIQLPPPPAPPPAPSTGRGRGRASAQPATDAQDEPASESRRRVAPAPVAPAPAPVAPAPVPPEPVRAERRVVTAKAAPPSAAASTPRELALEDLRAWLRAALPVSRPTLVRYGLWKRANEHFGSWEDAVAATGVTVSEPLWKVPRDPDVALDILVEALPDPVVARLTSLSLAQVEERRRQTSGPSPEQQLSRRIVATERLGQVPDAVIAAELAVPVAEVKRVREAEAIPAFRS